MIPAGYSSYAALSAVVCPGNAAQWLISQVQWNLIGADLMHLKRLAPLRPGVPSIGRAGVSTAYSYQVDWRSSAR